MPTIDTNPASGTRDFLAPEVARRRRAFQSVRTVFEGHGFEPVDTPSFERLDVLLGKYGEEGDQLIFKILRRGEHEETGEADLGLRYDLTVPLARLVAQHADRIVEPFKRYHLAPVWRAERPQRGRFREFVQCDVDVVGSTSRLADAEVILTVVDALVALGLTDLEVHLNSRSAVRALVEAYGIPVELEDSALIALDKRDRIGPDGVAKELRERGVPDLVADRLSDDLEAPDVDDRVRDAVAATEAGRIGLEEVDEITRLVSSELQAGRLHHDPFLARGLSYYTGPIFEVTAPGLGSSVAAGGRYDGLVGMFSGRDIPATGGSVGLERVLLLLDDDGERRPVANVLVTVFDAAAGADALRTARRLRSRGLAVDVYVEDDRLGKQLRYADRRGIRFCVLRGPDERSADAATIRDLLSGEQRTVPLERLADLLLELLGEAAERRA